FTEGHYFMFDLPLTSLVIMATYFLFKTDYFLNKKYCFLFFITSGLGMLVKWSFIIFIITPFIFYIFQNKTEYKKEQKLNLIYGFFVFLIISTPWYFYNLTTISESLLKYSFKRGAIEGLPKILSKESIFYYINILPAKITLLFYILFIISFIIIIFDKHNNKFIFFILIPLLFFTFLGNKKDRYIMPILPFIAVSISYLIFILKNIKYKQMLSSLVIIFSLTNYIYSTYNLPIKWKYSHRPSTKNWHVRDFLDKIYNNKNVTLSIVPDHPYINNHLYSFYANNFYKNIKIIGIFNFPMFVDYFLIKTGDLGPVFSGLEKRQKILNEILNPSSELSLLYEKIYEVDLPDNSKGILYKRKSEIYINYDSFLSNLNLNINQLLNLYLKNAKEFKFHIISNKHSNSIDKIIVKFKSGLVGDFKHKPVGLTVKNVEIEIDNITFNPYSLNKNKIELLNLNKITIKSLEINSEDLQNFIKFYLKNIDDFKIYFKDGQICIDGLYKKIPIFISFILFNPKPGSDESDVFFKFKKVKIGFFSIPSFFINFLLKNYNPLLVKSNKFIKVNFGEIKIEEGKIIIL
ncbi:MAG: hypothetical protein N3E50_05430, partial [Candidatus Goldbacteria bacterium]|nr:hypothetical protein [Candidatus Goldiibacteriota bacterium]